MAREPSGKICRFFHLLHHFVQQRLAEFVHIGLPQSGITHARPPGLHEVHGAEPSGMTTIIGFAWPRAMRLSRMTFAKPTEGQAVVSSL